MWFRREKFQRLCAGLTSYLPRCQSYPQGMRKNWFLRKDSVAPDVTSWSAGSEPKGMRKSGSVEKQVRRLRAGLTPSFLAIDLCPKRMRKSGSIEKKCSDSARALPPSFRGASSDPPQA